MCGRFRYQLGSVRSFAQTIWPADAGAGGPPRTPARAGRQKRPATSLGYATQPYISNKAHLILPSAAGAFTSGVRSNKRSKAPAGKGSKDARRGSLGGGVELPEGSEEPTPRRRCPDRLTQHIGRWRTPVTPRREGAGPQTVWVE